MSGAHTPGPWHVAPGNYIVADLLVPGDPETGHVVAEVPCCGGNPADLVLIAAAPRLLQALERIAEYESRYQDSVSYREAVAALRTVRSLP